MDDPANLMPAREAINRLGVALRNDETARRMIAGRLKDGNLSLRSEWSAFQFDVDALPTSVPSIALDKVGSRFAFHVSGPMNVAKIHILPRTWIDCRNFESDVRRWDWAFGTFVASGSTLKVDGKPKIEVCGKRLAERHVIGGVHFLRNEILSLIGELGGTRNFDTLEEESSYDAKDTTIQWVAECAADVHDNGVDAKRNASKLIERVNLRLAERGLEEPGRSTIYPFAKAIAKRLKQVMAD